MACIRTWSQAKYLAELGWEVTVVTPAPAIWRDVDEQTVRVQPTGSGSIYTILTGHRYRFLRPGDMKSWNSGLGRYLGQGVSQVLCTRLGLEAEAGWLPAAEEACRSLEPGDVDVILASGGPFCAFTLARRLSQRLRCPYVLDYRDLWTQNPHAKHLSCRSQLTRERLALADAAHVITVSQSMGEALDAEFGVGSKHTVIHNGYDPVTLDAVRPRRLCHFAIVYTGGFYPPLRIPDPVMAALRHLSDLNDGHGIEWFFHYYGPQGQTVLASASRYGVSDRVIVHGKVTHREALEAVAGSGVAVVITSVAREATTADRGIVTGKLFEPVGLGVPVLLVAPSGSDAEAIMQSTGCGRRYAGHETAGMARYLADLLVGRNSRPVVPGEYGWPSLSRRLDAVLRGCLIGRK